MTELSSLSEVDAVIGEILINANDGLHYDNIKTENLLDSGEDSLVCKYGNEVYKFYGHGRLRRGNLDFWREKLDLYEKTTNKAANFCNEKSLSFEAGNGLTYKLSVNPILDVSFSKRYNSVVARSPLVGGQRLSDSELAQDEATQSFLRISNRQISDHLKVRGIDFSVDGYNVRVFPGNIVITDLHQHLYNGLTPFRK